MIKFRRPKITVLESWQRMIYIMGGTDFGQIKGTGSSPLVDQ